MREKVPEGFDDHLLNLETLVLLEVQERELCLASLMGEALPTKVRVTLRRIIL